MKHFNDCKNSTVVSDLIKDVEKMSVTEKDADKVKSGQSLNAQLIEENRKLRNAKVCQVCLDHDACRLFLPCAHIAACEFCYSYLKRCPKCKTFIAGIVFVYFG
jgi:hypothetical protein